MQAKAFPAAFTPTMIGVFERTDGKPLTTADQAKVKSFAAEISAKKIKNVQQVIPAPASPKKLVQTLLFETPQQTRDNYKQLNDTAQTVRDQLHAMVKGTGLSPAAS
ncbi:hypothetical protein [Flexivirga caeni]|uniref:Uncharacterized protein n=1 Tax=Flexivirga caeni TaxID=2294115 RepID=A0A3M9M6Y8_9MICO|nr:hypothetical protein [Flexivirga caeni]RNI20643.1 hypothetical protein EFY87_13680 [Flexivirga caeni]